MYICTQNYDLKRGGTFETAKAGTFHSVTAGTSIPLFTDERYIEQIVLITRGIFNDLYNLFISDYIDYIEAPDDFFHIDWLDLRSGIIYGENRTSGDIEAARWSNLLSCLKSITNPKIYSIRSKIKRYIVSFQKQADDERARYQLYR